MSEVKWIKLNTHMFDDEKIRIIEQMPEADTILIIWIKLLAQAGKTNASGYIFLSENIPYTEEMLATIFNRPIGTVRLALSAFQRFGMIEIDEDSFISILNWEKHQNIDGLDRIREQNRLRKQRERERKKLPLVSDSDGHVTVTQGHAPDIDIDIDKEDIYIVFNHWLTKNIINHKSLNQKMKSHINARLKEYGVQDLLKAIDNYSTVLNEDNYYWTHKWTLQDFMKPNNIIRFLDESDPLKVFLSNKNSGPRGKPPNPVNFTDLV